MDKAQSIGFAITFVQILSSITIYLIIGRVIASWVTMGGMRGRGRFSQFLFDVTEPVMNLVKKLPHQIGMMDLSPIIAIFGIEILSRGVILLLLSLV